MDMENDYGLIYGLTNPYFKGLVKIGATRNLDVTKRMRVLGISVPAPFECAFAYKVPNDELFRIENLLHKNYAEKRIVGSEFFRVDPNEVDTLLRTLGRFEAMKSTVQNVIDTEEARKKKPIMDFFKMRLKEGDTLIFARDHSVTCTIASSKKVLYNGKEVSLSSITKDLLGYASQPSPHWLTTDGISLAKLYIDYVQRESESLQQLHSNISETAKSTKI